MRKGGLEPDALPWDHERGLSDLTSDDEATRVTDDWEHVDETMVVTPRVMYSTGRVFAIDIPHEDISTLIINEAVPCATYQVRLIAGQGETGVAEIEALTAPPVDGDRFRLALTTADDVEIQANHDIVETYTAPLPDNIRVTVELEVITQDDTLGCQLANPGLAPYEGAHIPVRSDEDGSIAINYDHDSIPGPLHPTRLHPFTTEGQLSESPGFVEITDSNTPFQTNVVEDTANGHSIDLPVVAFESQPSTIESVYIYLCGRYGNSKTSTCHECHRKKLFGGPRPVGAEAGDTLLLKDYKRDYRSGTDDEIIGPYTALSDEQKNIDPDAWDGKFSNQVEVEYDELFMLPETEVDVAIGSKNHLTGTEAQRVLRQLREEGVPIEIGTDGEIEQIDTDPTTPEDDEDDEDEEEEDEDDEDDEQEDGQDNDGPSPEDNPDRLTTILMAKDQTEPLPARDAIEAAANPGRPLLEAAYDGELRPELYERAMAHLVAGKNIIFYGPPGSGKTRIAKRLGQTLCSNLHIETANAEWTYQEVVGGYAPAGNDGFEPSKGVLTNAAGCCEGSLEEHGHPEWLLIDELNRANLDEAFGDVFTLLDLDHRAESAISYANAEPQSVPMAFRILGTMNTEDQAQLFALGYAFRRRFAFLEVPPAYASLTPETTYDVSTADVELDAGFKRLMGIVEDVVVTHFEDTETAVGLDVDADTQMGVPPLRTIVDGPDVYDRAVANVTPSETPLEFPTAIMWFVQEIEASGVAELGQGLIIDALRYVVAHYLLFPEQTEWDVVDHAVVAYLLPQLEAYTSELRRADTVATDSEATDNFERVIQAAKTLGLSKTVETLEAALESHEILR